jgi:chromate transport protein ChrA
MRRLSLLTAATVTIVLAAATPALADMSGQGWYGETSDKVVTNFGFILIIFFPLFIFIASLIYWQTDKRKDAKLEAAKARATSSEWKGGW